MDGSVMKRVHLGTAKSKKVTRKVIINDVETSLITATIETYIELDLEVEIKDNAT